ncbi:DedA family protein [Candidatus Saccharibacteria bacterium CPR2]|nr:DedA family protein [Candidatus Saccharibacteria bacterium CPR2]
MLVFTIVFDFDIPALIRTVGLLGVVIMVFTESGLLVGFFLPGDSLLFTAGFLASQGLFNIHLLALLVFIAAVAGDSVGYAFGFRVGPRLFNKEESLLFNKDNITRTQEFYKKHGGKTIVLARFTPIVRTFAPIIAGVGKMHYPTFLAYNIIGAAIWALGITYTGYFLGSKIPNVDKYLLPIVILIVISSVAPAIYHILKDPKQRKHLREMLVKKR